MNRAQHLSPESRRDLVEILEAAALTDLDELMRWIVGDLAQSMPLFAELAERMDSMWTFELADELQGLTAEARP